MVIGIVCSECISLPKWRVYVQTRAVLAQSHQRRFSRWLHNLRINVQRLYSPMIQNALVKWNASAITAILDTSQLWGEYCLIRLSLQYRGRAVPIVWRVIRHKSSSVSFSTYQAMLKRASRLIPAGVSVCLLADRGFADTALIGYVRDELRWHFRIRVKSNSWIHRVGKGWTQLNSYHLALGEVVLLHSVTLTKTHPLNGLHLALARDPLSRQLWMVVSDQPTTLQTFREYGERFQIEEEFLDEKSNGFQLERSEIRSVPALSHLCFVLAVTTLLLTVQGQQVVATGKRRWVDAHWQRGNSYLRIGWNWLKGVLHQGWRLFCTFSLQGHTDPEPAFASIKQTQKQLEREFTVNSYSFGS
ncbi:MAG: IS4 family transposase ISAcma44 [Chroococcidiopsis sp. SAG 2025]|nr:IS4 family transposase ISAcma44 [Chroococcidiopsis sp. SAG 2025]